ncbi:V-type ATP synthase subunit E [Caldivirga sp. UBA161]|uniref:V-type ATP synthase subunit E n=1 Tax=Caldivirga sp. UBA161 TaxID=1915569 RepID=UPI0025BF59B1|nr:V-type ATP synthase subunit E [Caldivirga sp. UBA161]
MSEQLIKLINSVMDKVKADSEEWISNLSLKYEAELMSVVEDEIRKHSGELEEVDRQAMLNREYKLYDASMSIKAEYLALIDELTHGVINRIKERINAERGSDAYSRLMMMLLNQAINVTQAKELTIVCSQRDKALISSLAAKMGISVEFKDGGEDMLGLIASTKDGSVTYEATIDDVLNRMIDYIRSIIKEVTDEVVKQ